MRSSGACANVTIMQSGIYKTLYMQEPKESESVADFNDNCAKYAWKSGKRLRAKSKFPWRNIRSDMRLKKEASAQTFLDDLIY